MKWIWGKIYSICTSQGLGKREVSKTAVNENRLNSTGGLIDSGSYKARFKEMERICSIRRIHYSLIPPI